MCSSVNLCIPMMTLHKAPNSCPFLHSWLPLLFGHEESTAPRRFVEAEK